MADKPVCTPVCGSPGDSPFSGEPPESDRSRDEAEDHPWVVLSGGNEERRPVDVAYKLVVAPSGLLGVRTPDGKPQQTAVGASKQRTVEKGPLLLPEVTLPKLQTPRYGHVACVTSGHEVLLVGGRDGQTVLNSVERFEETEERWVSMPSLHFARAHHAGCAVSGGRAVVLGGENEKGVLKSVELYHPVKRNWINLAPLQHQRHSFGAVAIGSNIFALGGRDAAGDHGRVLKTVEGLTIAPLSSPSCSRSSSLATAPSSPAGLSADTLSQGSPGVHAPQAPQQGTACDRAETLHAVQGAGKQACSGESGSTHGAEGWQSLPSMKHGRASFGVAQYRGLIFCAGGTNGVKPLSSVEMFDSSTNEWFELPSLNEARIGPICFVWLKGPQRRPHLCVAGGRQSSLHPVFQSVEVIDLLPLLPSTQEASANKTQSTAGQAAAGSAETRAEQSERETETPAAEWVLVGSAGVKLCWQQAAGVVAACWKSELLDSPVPPLLASAPEVLPPCPLRSRTSLGQQTGRRSVPHTLSGGPSSSSVASFANSVSRTSSFACASSSAGDQLRIPQGVVAAVAKRFQSSRSSSVSSVASSSFSSSSVASSSPSSAVPSSAAVAPSRAKGGGEDSPPSERRTGAERKGPCEEGTASREERKGPCGEETAPNKERKGPCEEGTASREERKGPCGEETAPNKERKGPCGEETAPERKANGQSVPFSTTRIRTLLSDDCLEANRMSRQELKGEGLREVMNRNLEEADEESDGETPPALPKTRVFRSNSSSGVGGVAATAPSDGSDSHGACSSGEKGPSKVQLLRQKIETQAAERQAAKKSGAAAGFGAGGTARGSGGGKREVIYDPLEWFES